jgi:hypothetical protein
MMFRPGHWVRFCPSLASAEGAYPVSVNAWEGQNAPDDGHI